MEKERKLLLEVKNLSVSFTQYEKGFRQKEILPLKDLNISIGEGELVAIVGSSGSGKSLLAHAILGILPYNAIMKGSMEYRGAPLTQERKEALRGSEIVLVPQSVSFLDPLMKVGNQIRKGNNSNSIKDRCTNILKRYGLEKNIEEKYPFELSGGMTRRVLISTAVMESPKLVIADEPTPGLHIDAARWVLKHFREIADEGAGVLLITHDLELALETADRIVVFYEGMTLEEADCTDFLQEETLRHPYSRALYRAMPVHNFKVPSKKQLCVKPIQSTCCYVDKCPKCDEACGKEIPYLDIRGGRVRCVHAE